MTLQSKVLHIWKARYHDLKKVGKIPLLIERSSCDIQSKIIEIVVPNIVSKECAVSHYVWLHEKKGKS